MRFLSLENLSHEHLLLAGKIIDCKRNVETKVSARMGKVVIVFISKESLAHKVIESGIVIKV